MSRVVLVMPTTTYRAEAFLDAARALGVDVLVASDRCHVLDGVWRWPETSFVVDFYDPPGAAAKIEDEARRHGGVIAVVPAGGESAALVAAIAAGRLGLPHNAVAAAEAAWSKLRMRELCAAAGVRTPRFTTVGLDDAEPDRIAREIGWPCVVKPLLLSGSRGVMRADDAASLRAAHARLAAMLRTPELLELDPAGVASRRILVESFVPGIEAALEGIVSRGELRTLAIIDKPDPLDGPLFEETIYLLPSRLPGEAQGAVRRETAAAAAAMGLTEGPVHAELRLPPDGPPVAIEIAARSIGGLCSRMLRFGTGLSLEDVILRHAIGREIAGLDRERRAAGVMMLPIPSGGVLKAVDGVDDARAIAGIDEVAITARIDQELLPLPEGSSYLGFVFASGESPDDVERALRQAHARLRFTIAPTLPVC